MSRPSGRASRAPRNAAHSAANHSAANHSAPTHSASGYSAAAHSAPRARSGGARSGPARGHSAPAASRSRWDDLPVQVVPTDNLPSFGELGLPRGLVEALARKGIDAPFPIQAATIPDILERRDLLGRAATGAGKTLAFALPMIARLEGSAPTRNRPRGLILVPTRELAMQVTDAMAPLASVRGLSVRLVAGGLPIHKQIRSLDSGVDILVATPGRLIDLIQRRSCSLDRIEITVLDEADHMADLGFLPVVRELLDMTPEDGQRLLFSATLDGDVALLVDNYLADPAVHAVSTAVASVDTMTHHVFRVPFEQKFDLVASIAAREGRSILFVRTKHGADRLARNLSREGVRAEALHGGRTQAQRNKALDAFRSGSSPVLVATDVAARGIHVDDVSLVLHVDPPQDHKDYLHRSGRTARAGERGTVVLLTTPADERRVRKLMTDAGVTATQREARAGDSEVADLTGARTPSGSAVREPAPSARPASSGSRPTSGGRYANARAKAGARPAKGAPRTGQSALRGVRTHTSPRPEHTSGQGEAGARRPAKAASSRHPQHAERRPRRARTY